MRFPHTSRTIEYGVKADRMWWSRVAKDVYVKTGAFAVFPSEASARRCVAKCGGELVQQERVTTYRKMP